MSIKFTRWDICWVNQKVAREFTGGLMPGDFVKERRMYLLLGPQIQLSKDNEFLCVPIKTNGDKNLAWHIPLDKHLGGTYKDCHIWVNQMYTLPKEVFEKPHGSLPEDLRDVVSTAQAEYLKIKPRHVV